MANEILKSVGLTITKSGVTARLDFPAAYSTMSGSNVFANVQTIPTSWTLIDIGSVDTAGEAAFKNEDATNYIELALDVAGTYKFAKLLAGQVAAIPLSTTALYAKATGASCDLAVVMADA